MIIRVFQHKNELERSTKEKTSSFYFFTKINFMRNLFLTFIVAICFSSCDTPSLIQHVSPLPNSGTHREKGEIKGKFLVSKTTSNSNNGVTTSNQQDVYEDNIAIQPQASVSLSDHFAIQGAFMHSSEKTGARGSGPKTVTYNNQRNTGELGITGYASISSNKTFFLEMTAGYGGGRNRTVETATATLLGGRFYNNNFNKIYLQPAIYFNNGEFSGLMGYKISFINVKSIETNYTDNEHQIRGLQPNNQFNATTGDLYLQFGYFFRNVPWLGLQLNFVGTGDINNSFNGKIGNSTVGGGIAIRLDRLKK